MKPTDIIDFRHELHQIPEIGLQLPRTQALLLKRLTAAGLEVVVGTEMTSVTAIVRGTNVDRSDPALVPTVLVRSDMDALPVQEDTGLPWAATNGAMHACGHDGHMAIVLAAAIDTHNRRDELHGDAVFFFQPGEEGHGGAQLALREGLVTVSGARPMATLGLHLLAHLLEPGEYASRAGAVLSGSTLVDITVNGRGGHGSAPHLARNPLNAAAEIVGAVGIATAHGVSMFEPSTVTFGALNAGSARNVIPDHAELAGVIRSFSEQTDGDLQEIVQRTVNGVACAHGVTADIALTRDTVPTVSDGAELDLFTSIAADAGRSVTLLDQPIGISEDFSWILREIPGVFLLVGARTSDEPNPPSNHSARATFADDVLTPTAELVGAWVRGRLSAAA
ncbi:M20 family metallopeptidase [Rhodococcus sp. D-6]|uniref:M20 family metallopeptidase n=1 Tax=Rhodococcus sp. D-6 TaxID=1387842 RepID=A0AAU7UT30_9NOCA|nr:M20 family metallopeptidase [Rhodococcus sp. HS-D2]